MGMHYLALQHQSPDRNIPPLERLRCSSKLLCRPTDLQEDIKDTDARAAESAHRLPLLLALEGSLRVCTALLPNVCPRLEARRRCIAKCLPDLADPSPLTMADTLRAIHEATRTAAVGALREEVDSFEDQDKTLAAFPSLQKPSPMTLPSACAVSSGRLLWHSRPPSAR